MAQGSHVLAGNRVPRGRGIPERVYFAVPDVHWFRREGVGAGGLARGGQQSEPAGQAANLIVAALGQNPV